MTNQMGNKYIIAQHRIAMKRCPFCGTPGDQNEGYCRSCRRTFDGTKEDESAAPHELDLSKDRWQNPWIAALMSLAGIGLGQFYNGETVKGLLFFAGVAGLLLLPLWTTFDPLISVLLVWAVAVADAFLSAQKINRLQKTFLKKSILFWPEVMCLLIIASCLVIAAVIPQVAAHGVSAAAGVVADTKYPMYAIPMYESAITLSPNDTSIRMNKVRTLHALGKDTEARSDLEYAIVTNPNDTAPLMMTGNILYDNGEYEASVSYFEKALALNRKDAQIWVRKGDAQLAISVAEMQNMRERYRTITSGSYVERTSAQADMNTFESMQSYRDAMTAYNEAIKLDPLVSVEISAHVLASTQSMVEMTSGILNDIGSQNTTAVPAAL